MNGAGIAKDNLLIKSKVEDISDVINTNLLGPIYMCKYYLPLLMKNKDKNGAIVNIGSIVGSEGNYGQTIYSATKSGLIGFTKTLSKEVVKYGIRVNMVEPGFTNTDLTKDIPDKIKNRYLDKICLKRFAERDEIAEPIVFLCSDLSSYITGEVLRIDGGMSL